MPGGRHKSGGNGLGIAAVGVVGLAIAWPSIQAMIGIALTIVTWAAVIGIGVAALAAIWNFVVLPYLEHKAGEKIDAENARRAAQQRQQQQQNGGQPGQGPLPRPNFAPPRPPITPNSPVPQPTGNGQGNGNAPPRWPGDRNGRPRRAPKPAGQGTNGQANGQHYQPSPAGSSERQSGGGDEKL